MSATYRKYFKRSKSLLKKPARTLKEEEITTVTTMLKLNKEIQKAYRLKELFYEYVLKQKNKTRGSEALKEWIKRAEESGQKEWKDSIRAFGNWFDEITNSFDYPWTNGYVEGSHNKINTIKRVSFGVPNFEHFRTKILLACSKD